MGCAFGNRQRQTSSAHFSNSAVGVGWLRIAEKWAVYKNVLKRKKKLSKKLTAVSRTDSNVDSNLKLCPCAREPSVVSGSRAGRDKLLHHPDLQPCTRDTEGGITSAGRDDRPGVVGHQEFMTLRKTTSVYRELPPLVHQDKDVVTKNWKRRIEQLKSPACSVEQRAPFMSKIAEALQDADGVVRGFAVEIFQARRALTPVSQTFIVSA